MGKYLAALAAAVVAVLAFAGCTAPWDDAIAGSGNVETETRDVSEFNAVRLHGAGELVITQGESTALVIESDDNILPAIESRVEDGTLSLGPESGKSIRDATRLVYTLTVTDLTAITLEGDATASVTDLRVDTLSVTLRGAGDLTISGETQRQEIEIRGAGSYRGRDFTSSEASVSIQGAGDVVVQVGDTLDIEITGAGGVTYYGDPTITERITGAGRVMRGSE